MNLEALGILDFFFFKSGIFYFMPFILSIYPELSKGSVPPGVPLAGDLWKEMRGRGEVKIGYFLTNVSSPSISPTFCLLLAIFPH